MTTKVANIDSATPTESEPEMTPEERAEEARRKAARDIKRKGREEKAKTRDEVRKDNKERNFWHKERLRWTQWERDIHECGERKKQFKEYWDRRTADDKECWREKDFANAVDKMSRAGYKGKWGNFDVPHEDLINMYGMYMQTTVGDVNSIRPSPDNEEARKKWDAWNSNKVVKRPVATASDREARSAEWWDTTEELYHKCAKRTSGITKDIARNNFIKRSNRLITLYGWNPPPGWS